ncbi:Glycosyl transferase family 2 [Algoriella xinjiangensis]|uniref:Glycosyl transferase family 2 n=1 Tax=Algoriella xinjiangensis TaxID=684065 RepID=A0A1I4VFA1_9FLAO|nr:glycosyltransferase family A protein [Algoriella xinjiangensis]SFM99907.1 Glycosyl transferase family 2 [Algoriella xinjiangensis]
MKDLTSIIIPIYKVEDYLEECLKSITNQTYEIFEVLLINDGSPDNSEKNMS